MLCTACMYDEHCWPAEHKRARQGCVAVRGCQAGMCMPCSGQSRSAQTRLALRRPCIACVLWCLLTSGAAVLASCRPFGAAPAGPAGWSWKVRGGLQVRTEGCVKIIGVPYSEHSSFPELRWVTGTVQPRAG